MQATFTNTEYQKTIKIKSEKKLSEQIGELREQTNSYLTELLGKVKEQDVIEQDSDME
ncbi:hypothetical protein HDV06_000050 [Boothiomyces sp. JEL0866]|nr:hypothetical protein HDV06_000050 [Boothiomyces sp. JEL0866]